MPYVRMPLASEKDLATVVAVLRAGATAKRRTAELAAGQAPDDGDVPRSIGGRVTRELRGAARLEETATHLEQAKVQPDTPVRGEHPSTQEPADSPALSLVRQDQAEDEQQQPTAPAPAAAAGAEDDDDPVPPGSPHITPEQAMGRGSDPNATGDDTATTSKQQSRKTTSKGKTRTKQDNTPGA